MVDEIDRLVDLETLDQVVVAEDESLVADVLDVLKRSGVEIVHTDDAVAVSYVEEVLAEMGSEEARPAGNH